MQAITEKYLIYLICYQLINITNSFIANILKLTIKLKQRDAFLTIKIIFQNGVIF